MFVKPNPDRVVAVHPLGDAEPQDMPITVLDPYSRTPLPAEGAEVPEDGYWMRLLRDGDVVAATAPASITPAATTPLATAPISSSTASPAAAAPISGTVTSGGTASGTTSTTSAGSV